jgi:hypothetical protein
MTRVIVTIPFVDTPRQLAQDARDFAIRARAERLVIRVDRDRDVHGLAHSQFGNLRDDCGSDGGLVSASQGDVAAGAMDDGNIEEANLDTVAVLMENCGNLSVDLIEPALARLRCNLSGIGKHGRFPFTVHLTARP